MFYFCLSIWFCKVCLNFHSTEESPRPGDETLKLVVRFDRRSKLLSFTAIHTDDYKCFVLRQMCSAFHSQSTFQPDVYCACRVCIQRLYVPGARERFNAIFYYMCARQK